MFVKLISLCDREIKVYYVTHVLKQSIKKKMCPNYILEFRNTNPHLLLVYLSMWARKGNFIGTHLS